MYESLRQKLRIQALSIKALLCLAVLFLFLFVTAQPASAASVIASGSETSTITWKLYDDGTLSFEGTGMLGSRSTPNGWYSYNTSIKVLFCVL